jgi:DNA-binding IclR family transcriptional regulator
MAYLSPREIQMLRALEQHQKTGLTKKEAGKLTELNPYYADTFLWQVKQAGFATFDNATSRYFITDAGLQRVMQLELPGMNL